MARTRLGFLLLLAVGLIAACTSNDFPDPSNPVAGTPWPDYELLRYDITDQRDEILGTVDFEVEHLDDIFQFRLLFLLEDGQVQDEVILTVDAATLSPRTYERRATDQENQVEVSATYEIGPDGATVLRSTVIRDDEETVKTEELGEFAFDTDSSAWLWRSIAFAQDYEVSYRSVNAVQQRSQLVTLRVVGQDSLNTPVGDFVGWQVVARPGLDRQNAWFDVEAPHRLIRWDLQPRRYTLREIVTERP
jgi:hypothetical protein